MLGVPRWRFTDHMVNDAPDAPGVYTLWSNGDLLYIGSADRPLSLRIVLLRHLSAGPAPMRAATHYSWRISRTPGESARRFGDDWIAAGKPAPRYNAGH